MWLSCRWLPGHCYAVDNVLWILLLHFYVVLRVLCIVAMVLLCSFESVVSIELC